MRRYAAASRRAARRQPARAAAFVRDAPAAARRRPARHPGAARPRAAEHDAALHARQRRAAARGLPEKPPASRTGREAWSVMDGSITVYTGPMFSGKTQALMARLQSKERAHKKGPGREAGARRPVSLARPRSSASRSTAQQFEKHASMAAYPIKSGARSRPAHPRVRSGRGRRGRGAVLRRGDRPGAGRHRASSRAAASATSRSRAASKSTRPASTWTPGPGRSGRCRTCSRSRIAWRNSPPTVSSADRTRGSTQKIGGSARANRSRRRRSVRSALRGVLDAADR